MVALVGPVASGKTSLVLEVARALAATHGPVGGVAQPRVVEEGRTRGYDLLDLTSQEHTRLATPAPSGAPLRWHLNPAAWEWARVRLLRARARARVLVVDELGLMEATGTGHWPALRRGAAPDIARVWLLSVRTGALPPITRMLEREPRVVHVHEGVEVLLQAVRSYLDPSGGPHG